MKNQRVPHALAFPLLIISLLLFSCPNPGSIPGAGGPGGSLTIQVGNHINSQTLVPPISMTAASYTVSGTGPGGATFSQSTSGGTVTVNNLVFGSWSVTVNALNGGGTIIGSGQTTATVNSGQTTTVAVTVVPLTGNGTVSLTVSWPSGVVQNAAIQASLTPPSGTATVLSFSINGTQATWSSTTIPAGYQTLSIQLMDGSTPVMGAVEMVRIVSGQTTTGTYAFTNVNPAGGSVQVNITPALANPIPVSISGVPSTTPAGTSVTATASVTDGTTGVVYVWYLNGVSKATGASYSTSGSLAAGYYRLDVTAITADGLRAGSATASLRVTGASGSAGRYVYTWNQSWSTAGSMNAFSVGSGGLLTPLSTPGYTTDGWPEGIAVTPNGAFLYLATLWTNSISAYAIGSGGLLTPLSTPKFSAGTSPNGLAITPNGAFLYVIDRDSNKVSAFAIGADGLLTPLSTPTFNTGVSPYGIAVTPNGSFLYISNYSGNSVSGYAVGSGGLLTPLSTPTFAAGTDPWGIAVTPNGSFLYVTNYASDTVSAYAIGSGGLLTPLSTPTFATGSFPAGVAVTPNGSFLYIANDWSHTVSAYAIGPGGLLTPLSTPSFAAGTNPIGLTVSPNGAFLYVTNAGGSSLSAYAIGSGGLLTPLSTPTYMTSPYPFGVVVVP